MATPVPYQDDDVVAEQSARPQESAVAAGKKKATLTKSDLIEQLAQRDAQLAELFQLLADKENRSRREAAATPENVASAAAATTTRLTPRGDDSGDDGEAVTADSVAGRRSEKIPDPPIFHNEPGKDTMKFEVWHRAISNKLRVNADRFATDVAKQAYIESRIGGEAADALTPYLRDTHPEPIDTSAKLLSHLWKEYSDPNRTQVALAAFQKLSLANSTDFATFKNDFVRLAGELGRNKTEWKDEFHTRLTPTMKTALAAQYVDPDVGFDRFARLGANIALVNKNAYEGYRPANPARGNRGGNRGNRSTRGGQPGSSGTPRLQGGGGAAPTKLTADDLRKLYNEGRCFVCRGKGHLSRECPKAGDKSTGVSNLANPEREGKLNALGNLDSLPGTVSAVAVGKDRFFLPKLLGGKSFLVPCTVANNGLSLTTYNALADTGANGYLFVSVRFARKMLKVLGAEKITDFEPQPVGGFDGKATQMVDLVLKAHVTIQGRTLRNENLIVVDSPHDIIIGRKWFDYHDVLVDCKRRRLLPPPEWPPDPEFQHKANIPRDHLLTKTAKPSAEERKKIEEDVCRREELMEKEDQQRRAGRASKEAIRKRLAAMEAQQQQEPPKPTPTRTVTSILQRLTKQLPEKDQPKRTTAPKKVRFVGQPVEIPTEALVGQDKGIAKMERDLKEPPQPTLNIAIISAVLFCYLLEPKRRDPVTTGITTLDEIDRILKAKSTIA